VKKIYIQHLEDGRFLGATGSWVEDEGRARVFANSGEAIVHCVREKLKNVRVAMLGGDPEMDTFYYPFKNDKLREEAKDLRKQAGALKEEGAALVQEVQANIAEIAEQGKTLPLRRKQKREHAPEEGGDSRRGAPDLP
jgi:hypothetical protein